MLSRPGCCCFNQNRRATGREVNGILTFVLAEVLA